MHLIDVDKTVVKALSEKGYTHAVVKPLAEYEPISKEEEAKMVVVPFYDFGEASYYLDSLDEKSVLQCVIVEMDSKLAHGVDAPESKLHLFVDVDAVDLKIAS